MTKDVSIGAAAGGRWSVVSGQWSVVSGRWSVVGGQWSVGQWSVVSGSTNSERGAVAAELLWVDKFGTGSGSDLVLRGIDDIEV